MSSLVVSETLVVATSQSMSSEEARQQAQAEKLTLLVADNSTGYFGVHLSNPGRAKPYRAEVSRGGKTVTMGYFATAEQAALCVARSPEGQAAAQKATAAAPLTSEEARQQAQAERLTLVVAENKSGYYGVHLSNPGRPKPYQARVQRGGVKVSLGAFATAEEAALCVAQSPEGQQAAAAQRAAAVAPLTSEEARQQALAEGLTLRVSDNTTGYFGVANRPGKPKPYEAGVWHCGKQVHLGYFATAEEAALHVARSPEGQAAAQRPAAALPLTREEARQQAHAEGLTLVVAESKTGYHGVRLDKRGRDKPYQVLVKRGGKQVHLGYFAIAEEAALCVARSPEGQKAAATAAAAAERAAAMHRAAELALAALGKGKKRCS